MIHWAGKLLYKIDWQHQRVGLFLYLSEGQNINCLHLENSHVFVVLPIMVTAPGVWQCGLDIFKLR